MMKRLKWLMVGCVMCGLSHAQQPQQQVFDDFLKEAGDQAEMFAGKMENGYSPLIYLNHPYWLFENYFSGEVIYDGLLYKDVQMRYDAYRKQLVVKTPEKHLDVLVPMHKVEKFSMGGTKFERRNGEMVAILFTSPQMELVERMDMVMKRKLIDNAKEQIEFARDAHYFLLRDGQVYEVSKLKTVLNLFPECKKELRSFARKRSLNFREHRQSSLVALVSQADQLLNQKK